jgi:glutamyl-tRNA reductase
MPFFVLGLNHHTAPVSLRERVSVAETQQEQMLTQIVQLPGIEQAVLLSTCNRTEIYCLTDPQHEHTLAQWFASFNGIEPETLNGHLYSHFGIDAVKHVFRVASGLDSLILGEPQILGQVKQAWSLAKQQNTIRGDLDRLFQQTFAMAKRVRTETQIGAHPVSVAYASVKLARQLFSQLEQASVLLIGAGETIELAAQHLASAKVKRLMIANRTLEHAQTLATRYGGFALPLSEFPKHLAEADIVISATASEHAIVSKTDIARALQQRKHKPMLLIDLAVPRDIEPDIALLEDIYLYTVDDLEHVLEESRASRQQAAVQAQSIIDIQAEHFFAQLNALEHQSSALKIRARVEQIRDVQLDKARQALARGDSVDEELETLAYQLSNKFMHKPSTALKQAALEGNINLLKAAEQLFDVDSDAQP